MQKKKIKTQTSVYLVTSINVIFTTGTVYILSWVLFKTEKGSQRITVIFLDTHKELKFRIPRYFNGKIC